MSASATASPAAPSTTSAPRRWPAWWPIACYPAAIPLAFVIAVWGNTQTSLLEVVRPALVTIGICLIASLVCSVLAGDRRFGGLAAFSLTLGLVVERLEAIVLLALVALGSIVIAHRSWIRSARIVPWVVQGARLLSMIALVAAVIAAVTNPGFTDVVEEAFLAPPGPATRPMPPSDSPDIVIYLVDGYPGTTAASRAPWFDATAFPAALRDRGFTVHADSRTNYLVTRQVLPSMFEVQHLDEIPALDPPHGPDQETDARRLREVLARSTGLAAIRAAGYDVVWVSAGWSHLEIRDVDRWVQAPGPSELEVALLRRSGAGTMLQVVDPDGYGRVLRERTRAAYATAAAIAGEAHDRPRFVFVHVPSPHPPIVFTADGGAAAGDPDLSWDTYAEEVHDEARRHDAFDQAQAIADMTLGGVDALTAASRIPPVVVVFSDHGTDVGFDPADPLHSDLGERTSAILAARTPGRPGLFDQPTTPVNVIGTIANAYLGAGFERRPDRTYAYDGSVLDLVPVDPTGGD